MATVVLLVISNIFMTFAWYGHLKWFPGGHSPSGLANSVSSSPLWLVILISWGIAFFEYCFQVPGNRMGASTFSLSQLKIIQEVISLSVFVLFSIFYMKKAIPLDFIWAGLCILGAVFFIFRGGATA